MLHALIAEAQARFDAATRELKQAALNFDVADEELLELREKARKLHEELAALDLKLLKKGFFSFLKFW